EKVPRRIIHFSSGETMEEYSTDEEEDPEAERRDLLSPPVDADDLGAFLLVSHVESSHVHHLWFVMLFTTLQYLLLLKIYVLSFFTQFQTI
ncbi:hypothetical protein GOODEAATRI_031463, partial [Goodea atripinnis]